MRVIRMDNQTFYECLKRIPGANKDMNAVGCVVDGRIPFLKNADAVRYALKIHPDMKPGSDVVVKDNLKCKMLALGMLPELERLTDLIDFILADKRCQITDNAKKRDSIPGKDLLEDVEKQRLQEEVIKGIGCSDGLSTAWKILHERKFELWECTRLKG